jgi:hypothetical protein
MIFLGLLEKSIKRGKETDKVTGNVRTVKI